MRLADFSIGDGEGFFLIAGPCVLESEQLAIDTAGHLQELTARLQIPFVFKSSWDKANRTAVSSYRGPGLEAGLTILQKVRQQLQVAVLTDVHEDTPMQQVAEVVDILQTPAFLCRQTGFLQRVAACNLPVNVKKGQFLSPWEMQHVVAKLHDAGNENIMVCERGFSFGYNNLVVDMRSLVIMRATCGCPVIFDATHSVQLPGGGGSHSAGQREYVFPLARAAIAVGIDGLFTETHPQPDEALSDGPNSVPLAEMERMLETLCELDLRLKQRQREHAA